MMETWVAKSAENVSLAPFDYFSIGHIGMGVGIFLAFYLIYIYFWNKGFSEISKTSLWAIFGLTFAAAIFWEVFENVLLLELGQKFKDRPDSIYNLVTDMIFVSLGAGIDFSLHRKLKTPDNYRYFLYAAGILLGLIAFWFLFRILTLN
ncbi:MAG: hypothetical protein ABEI74_05045 [Candidatus Pacearchaeota archaeon]